jgi:hypothetical protein
MDFIIELLFEIIPGKVWIFALAVLLIVGGVYVWRIGGEERSRYYAATGSESRTVQAEVRHKSIRSVRTSGMNDHDTGSADANFIDLGYYENDKYIPVEIQVERGEYDAVKEGDKFNISFHPANPEYIVTPRTPQPGVIWYRIGGGAMIGFAALILLMLVASLF